MKKIFPKTKEYNIPMVRPDEFRDLTDRELNHIAEEATCPYSGGSLYKGPEGGMCTNLLCKDEGCWARFNYCGFTGQYIGVDKPPESQPSPHTVHAGQIYGNRLVVNVEERKGTRYVEWVQLYSRDEAFFLDSCKAISDSLRDTEIVGLRKR